MSKRSSQGGALLRVGVAFVAVITAINVCSTGLGFEPDSVGGALLAWYDGDATENQRRPPSDAAAVTLTGTEVTARLFPPQLVALGLRLPVQLLVDADAAGLTLRHIDVGDNNNTTRRIPQFVSEETLHRRARKAQRPIGRTVEGNRASEALYTAAGAPQHVQRRHERAAARYAPRRRSRQRPHAAGVTVSVACALFAIAALC
jgi:hypothetical protein